MFVLKKYKPFTDFSVMKLYFLINMLNNKTILFLNLSGRHGDLMVSALDRSEGSGLDPGDINCVVFLGKTLNSHGAPLHPGV